jgi:hypothetical protein
MIRRTAIATLIVLLFSGLAASADTGRLAVGAKTGTLGLGGELMVNVMPDVNLRLGIGTFSFSHDEEYSDVDYDFDLDLLTYPITLDWYPFGGSFHLSAGVVFNDSEISVDSTYSGSLDIGGTTYTAAEIGVLSGDLDLNGVAPYVGLGWGNAFDEDKRWGFVTDLGVAFISSPDVDLSATGTLGGDAGFLADLALETADLEDDLEGFAIYPVFSASLYFRF